MSDSILGEEDKRLLDLGLKVRERIIKEYSEGSLPCTRGDQEFLLRAIEGIDSTVLKRAKLNSEDRKNQMQAEAAKQTAELLKQVRDRRMKYAGVKPDTDLDDAYLPTDIVPDETAIGLSSEEVVEDFKNNFGEV